MNKISILGVEVHNAKKEEALEFIIKGLEKGDKKRMIFTPNPEIIVYVNKDRHFEKVVNGADLALPDGVGLLWAAKMLGIQLQERITGIDFMEDLCKEAAKQGFTVGLIGGGTKIAEKTRDCLLQKYPRLNIVFAQKEWREGQRTDILFVALGFPKQEQWIYENLPKIPVRVAMAVGGSFDYISGAVPRAPKFLRDSGLEWLFRLIVQPWRIRRQLVLPKFIFLVLKERFLGDKS